MINHDQYTEPVASDDGWDDVPDTCKECGAKCSRAERRICLSELDGWDA